MGDLTGLAKRLAQAGATRDESPINAWQRLRAREGERATILDLYQIAADQQGVAIDQLSFEERVALARAALRDIWPNFETTPQSRRPGERIQVVPYDPAWRRTYDTWDGLLRHELQSVALRIEHVGSTAVPGMPAKPIVDIQVSVANVENEASYLSALERTGLQLRSRDMFHRYFRPFPDRPRHVHVHVCGAGSQWEREHLLLRDYLRIDRAARRRYADVKTKAAMDWADDGWAYTAAKTGVILDLLELASAWAAEGRPTRTDPGSWLDGSTLLPRRVTGGQSRGAAFHEAGERPTESARGCELT